MNKIFFFLAASVVPKGHLSPCDHASKILWQAFHLLRSIYVGVNSLILQNTLSEGNHIYPEANVILWWLSCNHQSLAGPESNTNTSNQWRGTVSIISDAVQYDTFTWVNGKCVWRADHVWINCKFCLTPGIGQGGDTLKKKSSLDLINKH